MVCRLFRTGARSTIVSPNDSIDGMRLALAVIALAACSKGGDPPRESQDRPPPPSTVAPPQRMPKRVTRMHATGFLEIQDRAGAREEQLPESPLHHGEYPEWCWVAPTGTLYAVGKQYTGVPGPDYGVVWKRSAKGEWSTAFRLKDKTFHSIVGRGANDIVVGSLGGYVTFDGTTWTPHEHGTFVNYVWSDGKRLLMQDQGATELFQLGAGAPKRVALVAHDTFEGKYRCTHGDVVYQLSIKDKEIGEADLSPEEEAEINAELKEIDEHPERVRVVK